MLTPRKRWVFRPQDDRLSEALSASLALSPVVCQVLLNRGLRAHDEARSFLRPTLTGLHDPLRFTQMERVVTRLETALSTGERILIYGDYDVDGMTATALLYRLFRLMGADVRAFCPNRLEDGYGLNPVRVEEAAKQGVRVVITVDNGTSAFEAAEVARRLGVDLIVTDHHEPKRSPTGAALLPPAYAVINPKIDPGGYPFTGLCGCGVAFKLAWALASRLSTGKRVTPAFRAFLLEAVSLVAIGTVADSVPLTDENRILVSHGLRALAATAHPGLRALLDVCRLGAPGAPPPNSEDVAFKIAPRLNAVGRLGNAELGLELLTTEDRGRAAQLATRLEDDNRKRRALDRKTLEEALDKVEPALARADGKALVLADSRWHPGVIGIVASRLVERFYRPTVLIALDQGRGRGSARSISGVPIHTALASCSDLLTRHGGHAQAAGLEIAEENIDAFTARLGLAIASLSGDSEESSGPVLEIDARIQLGALSKALVRELEVLGPFGRGNPAPVLSAANVKLAAPPRVVGRDKSHLQLQLRQGRAVFKAIGFGLGPVADALGRNDGRGLTVAFRPMLSTFRGAERVELNLEDLQLAS